MIVALLSILAFLCLPEPAFAWGGGIHLQIGLDILGNPALLPAQLAAILMAYPRDYLYGCVAADIIVGKKYSHYLLNCHRWDIGQKILNSAQTDAGRACAYGYLSHLAADVIAHNYYVPYKIMTSFNAVTTRHPYWEMRFENFASREVWDKARDICRSDQSANDALLRGVLTTTFFSFGFNKRIFNSIMLLSRLEKWQGLVQKLSDNSRFMLPDQEGEEFLSLSRLAVAEYLISNGQSDIVNADPTGQRALAMGEAVRKNLRLLYKNGRITKPEGLQQLEPLRLKLKAAIRAPELLEELHRV